MSSLAGLRHDSLKRESSMRLATDGHDLVRHLLGPRRGIAVQFQFAGVLFRERLSN
jgi:hypothetical protein